MPRVAFALLAAFWPGAALASDAPVVIAQNYPLAYFAERLAGDAATIRTPSPPDADPADWTPEVDDIAGVQASDLILLNGATYADWTKKASLPRARVLDTTAAFRDQLIEEQGEVHRHGPDGAHSHSGFATHTWLDFSLAAQQAEAIKARLARVLTEDSALEENSRALSADLQALHDDALALGESLSGVRLIASHPIYQYFARAYGAEVVSLHWEYDEPVSAAQFADLDALLAGGQPTVFMWEGPPLAETEAEMAKRDVAAIVFDPAYIRRDVDFMGAMRRNLNALQDAAGSAMR